VNEFVLASPCFDRAERVLSKELASKGAELIAWSQKIAMIPKSWNESEFLDFVDELQRITSHWQREIQDRFIEKLEGDKFDESELEDEALFAE
jgi:hypothetical protein